MTDEKSMADKAGDYFKTAMERSLTPGAKGMMPVRPYPRGIYLDGVTPEKLEFRLKSVHRRWRFAPYWIFAASVILVPLLGFWLGFDNGFRTDQRGYYYPAVNPSFSIVPAIILALLAIAGIIWAWFKGHPKIKIVATADVLEVAGMQFDRTHFGGMRIGYEIKGEAVNIGTLDTVMGDHFMGVTGLRVAYGAWGEDLDYMLNAYHAPEYIVWMNQQIGAIGKAAPKEHNPAEGRVTEKF